MSERASTEPRGSARRSTSTRTNHTGAADVVTEASVDEPAARTARERITELSEPLRERLEEPINRVTTITNKTMALFPVRVWRYFLAQNGFILSSGMSYQALFGVFAAVYVVFAVFGIWFTSNEAAMDAFSMLINTYAPGLIGDDGIISTQEITAIASSSAGTLSWTGAIALIGFIWTAIGWVTYTRIGVRSTFGLPKDSRSYVLLKLRDFVAGLMFGAVLILASVLSVMTTGFVSWLVSLIGVDPDSATSTAVVQFGAVLVVFVIDTLALAVLFRYLSGAEMPWRRMVIGSVLGSAALSVMQLLGGVLITFASSNPLLATFAVFIALLFWFRITSIVILVAASWIAVEAADSNETLLALSPEQVEAERRRREADAAVTVARVELRRARSDAASASWIRGFSARRRVARAQLDLDEAEAAAARVGGGPRASDVGRLE